jgi:hypothetical protein
MPLGMGGSNVRRTPSPLGTNDTHCGHMLGSYVLTVAILTMALLITRWPPYTHHGHGSPCNYGSTHEQVAPLGTNLRHQLETSAKRSNKFSSGFNPDHYL